MALRQQDIAKIANLSKLEMTAAVGEEMLTRPMAHPTHVISEAVLSHIQLRLRGDNASEPNNREANQQSAPAVERGLFLVPKVIE
jgi:aspartyl-tRNA(Asn)/glutamyl-tRNA(Gln) amidotransferase subunit C